MFGRIFKWLGFEANARAIMVLLTIGGAIGIVGTFFIDRVVPLISPSLLATDFGEGYRRGRREAELEFRLKAAEGSLEAIERARKISERIEKMSDAELDALTRELSR